MQLFVFMTNKFVGKILEYYNGLSRLKKTWRPSFTFFFFSIICNSSKVMAKGYYYLIL